MALTEFFRPKMKKTSITFSILAVSKRLFKIQYLFPRFLAWFDLSDYRTDILFVVDIMIDPNKPQRCWKNDRKKFQALNGI